MLRNLFTFMATLLLICGAFLTMRGGGIYGILLIAMSLPFWGFAIAMQAFRSVGEAGMYLKDSNARKKVISILQQAKEPLPVHRISRRAGTDDDTTVRVLHYLIGKGLVSEDLQMDEEAYCYQLSNRMLTKDIDARAEMKEQSILTIEERMERQRKTQG